MMENKGYFHLFNQEQATQIKDGFRQAIETVETDRPLPIENTQEYGLGFEIHGRIGPMKWTAEMRLNIDAGRKISLESSTLVVKNNETSVDLCITSKKSLLDLETFLVLGRCLPDKMDIHVVKQTRLFGPDRKKGRGPSMN